MHFGVYNIDYIFYLIYEKIMIPKEFLQTEYVEKNRSAKDIGKEIGLSDTQVRYWLRKHSLQVKPAGGNWRTKNLIGLVFDDLTVISQAKGDGVSSIWNCECSCGNLVKAKRGPLIRKEKKSCGNCKEHYNWKGHGEISGQYFSSIRVGALKRKLEFNINIEYIWDLYLKQDKKCSFTGQKLYFARTVGQTERTASLDRIDSSKGYVEGNVQWIHKTINIIKWNLDEETFLTFIKLIYEHKFL